MSARRRRRRGRRRYSLCVRKRTHTVTTAAGLSKAGSASKETALHSSPQRQGTTRRDLRHRHPQSAVLSKVSSGPVRDVAVQYGGSRSWLDDHSRYARTTPTTGSVATGSTRAARSPCATRAASTQSAPDEPTPDPRHRPGPGPRHPHHRRRHRRTTPRARPRPIQALPRHRQTTRPHPLNEGRPNPRLLGSAVRDVLGHHRSAPGRIRTYAPASGGRCSIP